MAWPNRFASGFSNGWWGASLSESRRGKGWVSDGLLNRTDTESAHVLMDSCPSLERETAHIKKQHPIWSSAPKLLRLGGGTLLGFPAKGLFVQRLFFSYFGQSTLTASQLPAHLPDARRLPGMRQENVEAFHLPGSDSA